MTLQQSFERSTFIEFVYADNIVILYFQNEAIREEFHDDIKAESKKAPFKLGIEIIDDQFVKLSLIDEDGNEQYNVPQVRYRNDILSRFLDAHLPDKQLKLYTDIFDVQNGMIWPRSNKWLLQQGDPDKVFLQGYRI